MDKYLKANLITGLGIDKLPPEKQADLLLKIGETIFQAVITRVIEELSDEDRTAFDLLLDERKEKDDDDAIFTFLQSKLPHLDQIVNEEIAEFKKESIETIEALSL